jgi:hypothetical protein
MGARPHERRLVKRLPEHNARTVSLGMHEVQRIADHASQQVRATIWLSLFTGLRRGELLGLTRDDIGADIITVRAGNTKTLRTRTVPIIAPARPWLQHVPLKISAEDLKTGFARALQPACRRSPSTTCAAAAAPCSSSTACRRTSSAVCSVTRARPSPSASTRIWRQNSSEPGSMCSRIYTGIYTGDAHRAEGTR